MTDPLGAALPDLPDGAAELLADRRIDEALERLSAAGFSTMQAMYTLVKFAGVSIPDAQRMVLESGPYAPTRE